MLVRDIMTTNVVTVSSDTLILDAINIMRAHRIERLPVVDRGNLVGMVTKDVLERAAPSQATSLTRWELEYLVAKMKIKDIMKKDVVSITADFTVECAIATAQAKKVGSLPVLENDKVIGIVTTNDFFYKILNPLMGIGEEGVRIIVYGAGKAARMGKVMKCVEERDIRVMAVCTVSPAEGTDNDLLLHLYADDATKIIADLKGMGFAVNAREHKPC
ncbi:CBS domain-containing protein [Chloroflexota bacterium]